MSDTSDIYLHSDIDPDYSGLLNTHLRPFSYNGRVYKTAEHLFQALKFTDNTNAEAIRQSDNPLTLAHDLEAPPGVKVQRRADWYKVNKVMLKIVLYHKFIQHNDLKQLLLSTGSRRLLNNVADPHWGIGQNRDGGNQFGVVLMEVRRELCNPKSPEVPRIPPLPKLPEPIRFDEDDPEYYRFAFTDYPVTYDGIQWKTTDHLFEAWKFSDNAVILGMIFDVAIENLYKITRLGKRRDDWDVIQIDVMTFVVHLKFTCDNAKKRRRDGRTLQKMLTDTEGTELIWNVDDELWGSGKGGEGRNELGKALVRVRDIILYDFEPPREPPRPPRYIPHQRRISRVDGGNSRNSVTIDIERATEDGH